MRKSLLAALAVLSLMSGSAQAVDLATPSGLNPGDKFRYIFLTTGTTTAASTDIATYDAFVTAQAGTTTYQGSPVTWRAIGSTATVNARDHVGGFSTNVPVYLVTGIKVASNLGTGTDGLWSGTLQAAVNYGIGGNQITADPLRTWTGSQDNGNVNPGFGLGSTNGVNFGSINSTSGSWLFTDAIGSNFEYRMVGISAELTVVPEPGTIALTVCAAGVLAIRMLRKRK
jgi:hypothetical protein